MSLSPTWDIEKDPVWKQKQKQKPNQTTATIITATWNETPF